MTKSRRRAKRKRAVSYPEILSAATTLHALLDAYVNRGLRGSAVANAIEPLLKVLRS